uniref:CCHC-type domain-containing protein n=1 Tax=Larimichthys crocea TaxID=215358 RepID=A0A0F8C3I3_LARCR
MASSETPSLSIRHGVRVQPDPSVPVEEVLLAVGDQVGHANLSYASRMNKGVVVFVKEERLVADLLASGVTLNGLYLQVSPLAVPFTRVTVSGVPPFIPNEALEQELRRFGKMASGFKTVGLGCKSDKLRHVQSFRRQVNMFLTCPSQTLDVSFRVRHGEGHYMVYASTGSMKCFECEDVGHKRVACPHRPADGRGQTAAVSGEEAAEAAAAKRRSGRAPPGESDSEPDSNRQTEEQPAETAAVDSSAASGEGQGGTETTGEVQTAGEEVCGGHSGPSQAAGVEVRRGESGGSHTVGKEEEGMDCDSDSDCASVTDSQTLS